MKIDFEKNPHLSEPQIVKIKQLIAKYHHIFYDMSNFHDHDLILNPRYLGPSPSDEDFAYTMASAAFRSGEKNISLKLHVQISRTKRKRRANI